MMERTDIVMAFTFAAAVQLGFAMALYAWGAWVAKRRGGTRFWKVARFAPVVAWALATLGVGITCWMLVRAFDAVAHAAPEQKAELLAQAISNAMNATAILLPPSSLLYVVCLVAFFVATLRAPVEPAPSAARDAGDEPDATP